MVNKHGEWLRLPAYFWLQDIVDALTSISDYFLDRSSDHASFLTLYIIPLYTIEPFCYQNWIDLVKHGSQTLLILLIFSDVQLVLSGINYPALVRYFTPILRYN